MKKTNVLTDAQYALLEFGLVLPEDGESAVNGEGYATKGGPGSGNFGHAGRPGQVGGSAPSNGRPSAPGPASPLRPWQSPFFDRQHRLKTREIEKAVAKAIAERPERRVHGNTGTNAFWLVGDKVYSWDKWGEIPKEEQAQAIGVHSHSASSWEDPKAPAHPDGGEAFEPLNSADIAIWFRAFTEGKAGPAEAIILADGRMEVLTLTPKTDARVVKMRDKRLGDILEGARGREGYDLRAAWYEQHKNEPGFKGSSEFYRERLREFCQQYGIEYDEGLNWKRPGGRAG